MKRMYGLLGLSLVGVSASTCSTAPVIDPHTDAPVVDVPEYRGTRFSALTSEVWRYRQPFVRRDLDPVTNQNPHPEPQPHRDRPERLALNADHSKLYVTLAGTEAVPGQALAVVNVATGEASGRIEVGRRPYAPFMHPGGRYLVVTNELSNYASIVDTQNDRVCGEIELDFYAQGLAFAPAGDRAWVAIRYLDQVMVVELKEGVGPAGPCLQGVVRPVGGFDDTAFYGGGDPKSEPALSRELLARGFSEKQVQDAFDGGHGGVNAILRANCGSSTCHAHPAGGLVAGPESGKNFLSAVESSIGGDPWASPLIQAVTPMSAGGYGDQRRTLDTHPGGVIFRPGDPELDRLVAWIEKGYGGPGIPVGNPGSHPKDVTLSPDGKHLFVGNTGTMDVTVIDVEAERQVGGIYIQNVASHVAVVPDPREDLDPNEVRDQLLILTMGVGFGTPPARDPEGAETWDREHPAAQFTVLRDTKTTDPHPIEEQAVMGPFDAVDGTWAFKMRDIQNDLVAIDLSRLKIPRFQGQDEPLEYLVKASTYESHEGWVRYTSDTAEATTGDIRGDIPPELMRVPGAFPEWASVVGDRIFVSMAGTFEIAEWRVDPSAADPADRLTPVRVYETGLRPVGVLADANNIYVANQLSETVSIIDRESGERRDVVVGDLARPALDTDAERGELVVHTTVFSSDGDVSCLHCHYRDTGDGRGWGAAETVGQDRRGDLTHGGTLGIPQMRNIFAIQPYYFEGTHRLSEGQGADVAEPASSIDFDRPVWAGDFSQLSSPVPLDERRVMHEELKERVSVNSLGSAWYELEERRNAFFLHQSMTWMGAGYGLTDLYRFVGEWLGNTPHLLPNPIDQEHPSVVRGERLFNDPSVMCGTCHVPGEFTNKDEALTHNDRRALPQLTTMTRRDASYTLVSVRAMDVANGLEADLAPEDRGRVEDVEGSFTTMQLRGIFDRPPTFLHHARARSLREVVCTPDHPALRRFPYPVLSGPEEVRADRMEVGFNETTRRTPEGPLDAHDQISDTHGGTSHLTPRQVNDLVNFMLSLK